VTRSAGLESSGRRSVFFRKFSKAPSRQLGIFTVAESSTRYFEHVRSPVRLISMTDRVVPLKLDYRPNRESNSPFPDSSLILKLLTSLMLTRSDSIFQITIVLSSPAARSVFLIYVSFISMCPYHCFLSMHLIVRSDLLIELSAITHMMSISILCDLC